MMESNKQFWKAATPIFRTEEGNVIHRPFFLPGNGSRYSHLYCITRHQYLKRWYSKEKQSIPAKHCNHLKFCKRLGYRVLSWRSNRNILWMHLSRSLSSCEARWFAAIYCNEETSRSPACPDEYIGIRNSYFHPPRSLPRRDPSPLIGPAFHAPQCPIPAFHATTISGSVQETGKG